MLDKVIEQLGELTQQKIADALATIYEKTDTEREQINGFVLETHGKLEQRLQEIEKDFQESIDSLDSRRDALYVEETQQIVEKLNQLEVFAGQLANIKDGEKGDRGEQGFQGEPGLDKPILEPVQLKDKDYPKSTLGVYNGGLWISTKDSVGDPDADPHAWTCILDAMTTMSVDLQEDRSFKLSVRMATGKLIEDTFKIPFPEHKGIWEAGDYQQGDIVTKGSSFWQAMEDTSGEPPGNGWKQILTAPRGKVGPEGKSIMGPQGKPGRNGLDAKIPEGLVDELIELASQSKAFEDGREAAYAITSFRGYFSPTESYKSGDVVNVSGALFLCTRSGKYNTVGGSPDAWVMVIGSGGVGGSSGSSDITVTYTEALSAYSLVDQDPSGLGVALQLTLGDPQTTDYFDVDAAGNVTCLVADTYEAILQAITGRDGTGGESQIYIRVLIDGIQSGASSHTILDTNKFELPATYTGTLSLDVGQVITVEIIRDTDGDNSGGVRAGVPDVVGWNKSPSVSVQLTRVSS